MAITQATPEDAPGVMDIVRAVIAKMQAAGSDQWNERYPTLAVFEADIRAGSLHVLRSDSGLIIGAVVLDENQPPAYAELAWTVDDPRPLVIHRLCVHPSTQGTGTARRLMDFAEAWARHHCYRSIRLDAYIGNARAIGIYERRGYQPRGRVRFPNRDLEFLCFEFPLDGTPA